MAMYELFCHPEEKQLIDGPLLTQNLKEQLGQVQQLKMSFQFICHTYSSALR